MHDRSSTHLAQITDKIEETSIAACLGLMTLLTFDNVIARYVFNANILWALEATVFLFAWLVLMGASYGVKKQFHIGVDVVINMAPPKLKKLLALLSVFACVAFSIMLLVGSWNYWSPFVGNRSWLETEDIPMPAILSFLENWVNQGEPYEKLPRFIPYLALPLGMALLTFRFLQLSWRILTGQQDKIISSHEAEDELEDAISHQNERGEKM